MDGRIDRRAWTVDDVNAMLPRLTKLLESAQASIEANRVLLEAGVAQTQPGVDPRLVAAGTAALLVTDGIVLRDLERGLLDFRSVSPSGRPFWLCWVLGEDEVSWWHWPEDGFAGRTPLNKPPE